MSILYELCLPFFLTNGRNTRFSVNVSEEDNECDFQIKLVTAVMELLDVFIAPCDDDVHNMAVVRENLLNSSASSGDRFHRLQSLIRLRGFENNNEKPTPLMMTIMKYSNKHNGKGFVFTLDGGACSDVECGLSEQHMVFVPIDKEEDLNPRIALILETYKIDCDCAKHTKFRNSLLTRFEEENDYEYVGRLRNMFMLVVIGRTFIHPNNAPDAEVLMKPRLSFNLTIPNLMADGSRLIPHGVLVAISLPITSLDVHYFNDHVKFYFKYIVRIMEGCENCDTVRDIIGPLDSPHFAKDVFTRGLLCVVDNELVPGSHKKAIINYLTSYKAFTHNMVFEVLLFNEKMLLFVPYTKAPGIFVRNFKAMVIEKLREDLKANTNDTNAYYTKILENTTTLTELNANPLFRFLFATPEKLCGEMLIFHEPIVFFDVVLGNGPKYLKKDWTTLISKYKTGSRLCHIRSAVSMVVCEDLEANKDKFINLCTIVKMMALNYISDPSNEDIFKMRLFVSKSTMKTLGVESFFGLGGEIARDELIKMAWETHALRAKACEDALLEDEAKNKKMKKEKHAKMKTADENKKNAKAKNQEKVREIRVLKNEERLKKEADAREKDRVLEAELQAHHDRLRIEEAEAVSQKIVASRNVPSKEVEVVIPEEKVVVKVSTVEVLSEETVAVVEEETIVAEVPEEKVETIEAVVPEETIVADVPPKEEETIVADVPPEETVVAKVPEEVTEKMVISEESLNCNATTFAPRLEEEPWVEVTPVVPVGLKFPLPQLTPPIYPMINPAYPSQEELLHHLNIANAEIYHLKCQLGLFIT